MTYKSFLAATLILFCHLTRGQNDVCECCAYNSLKFKNDFTGVFPPDLIQKAKVQTVTVYTESFDVSSKAIAKYREMKFKIDNHGQVTSKTEYNRKGKPHSIYEFERNAKGQAIKQTFTYLDSLEQKSTGFSAPEVIDYTYDTQNRLVKSQERHFKANSVVDEKSNYSRFQYDTKGRLIEETRQYYYEGSGLETAVYKTTFTYFGDKLAGESKTYENKKLFLTTKFTYNKSWRPIKEEEYNNLMNRPAATTNYKYDLMGRLVYYETRAGGGSGSECPDGGTFTETYEYDDKGLLSRITHSFGKNTCVMTFEYN